MKKILVIDDDDLVRNVITKMLEREGYEISNASNGKEGVDTYAKAPTDLVITDLIMPEQDGIETIIELKKNYKDIKIIAISGGGQIGPGKVVTTDYLTIAKKHGAACVLNKPVERETLIKAVKEAAGPGAYQEHMKAMTGRNGDYDPDDEDYDGDEDTEQAPQP